jgi:hypothetical protein
MIKKRLFGGAGNPKLETRKKSEIREEISKL